MFLKICLLYAVLLVCDNNTRRRCIRITYVLEKNNNPANKANLHPGALYFKLNVCRGVYAYSISFVLFASY